MKQHFVTFFSPGSFVSETTTKLIASWSVSSARQMARRIKERYGATPYGFQFLTKERKASDLDSRVVKRSPLYFLPHCRLRTFAEVMADMKSDEGILRSNMEINKYKAVVETTEGWKTTLPFGDTDILLKPVRNRATRPSGAARTKGSNHGNR